MATTLYRAYDEQGRLLYVGIAENVFPRLAQHQAAGWARYVARITLAQCGSRKAAAAAELYAIRTEDPVWNVAGRPIERWLRWMVAYPNGNPDEVDLDQVRAAQGRKEVAPRERVT